MKKLQFLLGIAILLLASCSKSKNPENLIPKDAKFAMVINTPEILKKLKEGGIQVSKSEIFTMKSLMDTTFKPTPTFWKDLPETGMDTTKPMVFAVAESPNSGITKKIVFYGIMAMDNKKNFEKYIEKQVNKDLPIEKGGLSFINTGGDGMVAYNSSYLIFANEEEVERPSGRLRGFNMRNSDDGEILKQLIKELIRTPKSKSLTGEESFKKLGDKFDIKIWGDLEFVKETIEKESDDQDESTQFVTRLFGDMFKGTTIGSVINFEKGKMLMSNSIRFSDELAKIMEASPTKPIDLSLLNGFQGDSLFQLAGTSISPLFLKNYVETFKLQTLLSAALEKSGITEKDIYNMFGGTVISVTADVKYGQSINSSNSGYIISLNDRAALEKALPVLLGEKLIKVGNLFAIKTSQGNEYFKIPEQYSFIGITDKAMIVTPNKTLAESYVAGTGKNNFESSPLYKFVNGKKGAGYILPGGYSRMYSSLSPFSSMFSSMSTAVDALPLGDMYYESSEFKNNTLVNVFTINLTENKVNFLPYIIKKSVQVSREVSKSMDDEFSPGSSTSDRVMDVEPPKPAPPVLESGRIFGK